MRILNRFHALGLLPLFCVICPPNGAAQVVIATVAAGGEAVAVNTVTNKVYVPNFVIDGATNSITTVTDPNARTPFAVAVNSVTDKIYVANRGCGLNDKCIGNRVGNVTVIDGATNSTTTVTDPNATTPFAVAVNSVTDKIYVANYGSGNVTVIDGATNSTTTVSAGGTPVAVAVNAVTNKIYVANYGSGNVTVIDGATNSTTTVTDPNAISPNSVAVNSATNKIYVANLGDYPGSNHGNVTVIDGATNATTTITDPNASFSGAVALNSVTNKVYVANANDSALSGIGSVTIIDGTTNAISTVRDPNAMFPYAVAVDSVTNTIYVANQGGNSGSVTVINGATNSVTTIIDPNSGNQTALAVDPTTNKIYVAGFKLTVIDGGATPTTHILSLLLTGSGSGTVTSNPAGINCTTSCTASFATGTDLTLTASPSSGVTFSGWSTNCKATGACNVTMTSDDFVGATFSNEFATDFSIQPASEGLLVPRGSQLTDIITMTPVNGISYASAIQLSCAVEVQPGSVPPGSTDVGPMPTCALSSSSVTPGANSVTSTLTITAPRLSGRLIPSGEGQLLGPLYALFLPLPGLTLMGLARGMWWNRRRQLWLLCGLFVVFAMLQAGCGGGSSRQQTRPQNYTVTVTATSGAVTHTAQVIVIVP